MQLKANRRSALRAYFVEVARDLVERGLVKRQNGESLQTILKKESRLVLHEVSADFVAVSTELGMGFLGGAATMLGNATSPAAKVASMGLSALAELLTNKKKG